LGNHRDQPLGVPFHLIYPVFGFLHGVIVGNCDAPPREGEGEGEGGKLNQGQQGTAKGQITSEQEFRAQPCAAWLGRQCIRHNEKC
jgi:hypothetical protein